MVSLPNPLDKGAPDAPDYKGASAEALRNSRPNQSTPWASSVWTHSTPASGGGHYAGGAFGKNGPGVPGSNFVADPAEDKWSQQVSLAPGLDQANKSMMDQLGSAWANPLDNGAQARQHAEDAIYGRATSRLDPMWGQRQHGMQADLANQGIDPNSEAYAKASGNFGRDRNDAYTSALMEAIMGGGQEATRQQGMDLRSRFAPLQGMQGLQGLSGMPSFQTGGNPLAAAGMQGQYGMDAANHNQRFWADTINGGMGLAGAFSDERLKEDIARYPVDILPGVPLASFRYRWEPEGTQHFGVIAQDLEATYPHLVTYRDGYRCVPARFLLS